MTEDRPVWECDVCGEELGADDGVIAVSYGDIARYDESSAAWDSEWEGEGFTIIPGDALRDRPRRATWHVRHYRCGADEIERPYSIDVNRIGTWSQVAGWTAHLLGKRWIQSTTWDRLLRKAGARQA